ncbi:MAG: aminotransferase class I/II-fold pyridoxal phosphate-dependent enzyme, partial [Paludibacteraceae bacterium]|nr:aminotransferase class I/II-fold pyridoxal phosphate-dependent enzyme [Paludibacteraceae bacterium]
MQAIILAAGMGKRLGELTKGNTKCMIEVGGETLISRLLHQLDQLHLQRIILVVGYKAKELREYLLNIHIQTSIEYVENTIYDKTNNIYSLYLAKDYLTKDDTLLFESDIIMEDSLIQKLIENPYPDLALVDKYESWMDGTVVTIDEENRILRFIPNSLFKYEEIPDYYKTVNVYKFSKHFSSTMYVPFLEAYCKALGRNEYYEQVLRVITMLDNSGIRALPLNGEQWYEIDDIQDLDIAESIFTEHQYDLLCSRFGGYWRYPHILDFCYLVNPYFPNQRLLDEMSHSFARLLTEYPSGLRVNNLLAAKDFGIKQDYILVGNGAAELIKVLSEQMLGKVGVVRPTFEEYPNRMMHEQVVVFEAKAPSFSYTADDLMTYFADKNIGSLVLINPDNPSGNYISYADCLRLADWCQARDIMLIMDESFIDFSMEHPTFLNNTILERYDHLVVIKSISKSFGVPGLRLGILASSNAALMTNLRRAVSIWNINSFAEFFLQILGKYEKSYQEAMNTFRRERARMMTALAEVSYLRVLPSEANYVLCEVLHPHTPRELAVQLLKKHSILIKDCTSKCHAPYIRLAIRNTKDNNLLI